MAQGVKVTAFDRAFEAGCVRGLGQEKGLALGWRLVSPPSVFSADLGGWVCGVTVRGERKLVS